MIICSVNCIFHLRQQLIHLPDQFCSFSLLCSISSCGSTIIHLSIPYLWKFVLFFFYNKKCCGKQPSTYIFKHSCYFCLQHRYLEVEFLGKVALNTKILKQLLPNYSTKIILSIYILTSRVLFSCTLIYAGRFSY